MKEDRLTFFRQSTWMLIATIAGGTFMFLTAVVAQRYLLKDQYGVFMTLLAALAQMGIPALGLQTVFAHQAGTATTDEQRRELAGAVRSVMMSLFVVWLGFVVCAQIFEHRLLAAYKIGNSAALWFTVDAALLTLLSPIFVGLLQGRQDFQWYGFISIFNGAGRLVPVLVLIMVLHFQAAGVMAGVAAALLMSVALLMWRTRMTWRGETAPFRWKPWLRRVVPLTIGLGTFTYMQTHDPVVVQHAFTNTGGYNAARLVGAALVFLTAPLAVVLFPKIARSHALSEKSNVLLQALGATGLIGALAALASTLFPELPLRIMSGTQYIESAPLVPWFAWCMWPLAIANVLINNLLARERFAAVPWLLAVAAGYGITLQFRHDSFTTVIRTLGLFGLLLVVVCVVFTIRQPRAGATRR